MLDKKSIRMLEILNKQVSNCTGCDYTNGRSVPFWTPYSKYAIIGESPSFLEVKKRIPFSGQGGKILVDELLNVGFKARDFLIINSVQCVQPLHNGRLMKPTEEQILSCQPYLRKYLKIVNPEKILCLGNYGKHIFTRNFTGVLRQRGVFNKFTLDGSDIEYPALFTISPNYCIYNREEGIEMLRQDIKLFRDTKFTKAFDWSLPLGDFLI